MSFRDFSGVYLVNQPKAPASLDECAREPIHIPGAIQPHGALLAVTLPLFAITHLSENLHEMLGLPDGALAVGADLRQCLPRKFMHDIGNTLQAASIARIPERLLGCEVTESSKRFDVIAHVTADGAILEFVPVDATDSSNADSAVLLRAMLARLSRATTTDRLLKLAAQQIRAVTGFDRVMIYKFRSDQSGVVIAESLRPGLDPYLGLHYPASDIPAQARELYRRQPLRQIPDVSYRPVPVLPANPPLDLSLAHLRSVSPIHLEYCRNMGSAATLTVSILRGGVLWGLFSCHHEHPRRVAPSTCAAMELFAQVFSLQLEAREQAAELAEAAKATAIFDQLRDEGGDKTVGETLDAVRRQLGEVLSHDGMALWIGGRAELFGSTPAADRLPELARHIEAASDGVVYASSNLSAELPDALRYTAQASGVLAVPLSRGRQDLLLFFRREQLQTVVWGGDPNKPVTLPANGGRIGPRQSFAAWKEIVRGASSPWRPGELQLAKALQVHVLEYLLSHARTVDEARRATAESQGMLIAELGHRVKNIFALIRSIVRQSRSGATSIDSYVGDLERRIAALSVAHDQATHVGWRPASLRRLLEEQARTWAADGTDRIELAGPPVLLDVRAVQAFALVLHEMMTNSAKYGALSVGGGTISIHWSMTQRGLTIAWREKGGPTVVAPTRRGFGSVVIEQTVPFELNGTTDVRYEPGGVEADLFIPAEHATPGKAEDAPQTLVAPLAADMTGRRILLVEDSMMIALDAQASLEAIGAKVEIVGSVSDGLRALGLGDFSIAVLDINLRGETSIALADALLLRRIPFIFATGYGDRAQIPDRFRHLPKVTKPYDAAAIASAFDDDSSPVTTAAAK